MSNMILVNDHSWCCLRCSLRSDRQRLCDTVYHPGSDCNGSRCPLCSCFDATCFWVSLVWCDSGFSVFLDEPWSWHSMKPRWNNHPARNSSTGHMCNGWFTFSCLSFDDWTLNALVRLSPAATIQENQTASASLGDTWATPGSGEFSDRLNMIIFIEKCFFLIWVGCQPTTTSLRNPATSLDRRGRLSYSWFWKHCSLIYIIYIYILYYIYNNRYRISDHELDYMSWDCTPRWWIENVEARRVQPTGSDPSMVNRTNAGGRVSVSGAYCCFLCFCFVHWNSCVHAGWFDMYCNWGTT